MRLFGKLLAKSYIYKMMGLLILDGLLFLTTNARSVASIFLVVGFVLLLMTGYYLFRGLFSIARLYGLKIHNQRQLAISLTGACGALIALQSVGALSTRDALVILPIGLITYVYSSYGANKRDQLL